MCNVCGEMCCKKTRRLMIVKLQHVQPHYSLISNYFWGEDIWRNSNLYFETNKSTYNFNHKVSPVLIVGSQMALINNLKIANSFQQDFMSWIIWVLAMFRFISNKNQHLSMWQVQKKVGHIFLKKRFHGHNAHQITDMHNHNVFPYWRPRVAKV